MTRAARSPGTAHAYAPESQLWPLMFALAAGFMLSQAYRTVAAIMAPALAAQFDLSATQLGAWAATFHFAFGVVQFAMGIAIDLYGLRRTLMVAMPISVAGALLCTFAQGYPMLMLGQALIGAGCAPAFLVCTVFIARRFLPERFTQVSGMLMSIAGFGAVLTSTPMAWLIDTSGWRAAFGTLTALSVLSWLLIAWIVRGEGTGASPVPAGQERPTLWRSVREMLQLFALPHTLGIVLFASVSYAGFITLRGLWLGPMLIERHGFSLVASGNVALAMTLLSIVSPTVVGRLDPGGEARLRWLMRGLLSSATWFMLLALHGPAWFDVALLCIIGALSGFGLLQYGYVRGAYPPEMTGRAMGLFTMSMFLGIALMQWVTGAAASLARGLGWEPFAGAFGSIAVMQVLGALAFWQLPRSKQAR